MSPIEVRDEGAIRWIGLNRPDKRNAIDQAMSEAFSAVLDDARKQPCVLIVHSVTPGIFAAGADIAELRERDADAALLAINAGLFDKLEAHRWPTIAAIDGAALGGGCELALACDLRVASDKAFFAQPEPSLGILAGAGGNWRLAQAAGQQVARRMLLRRRAPVGGRRARGRPRRRGRRRPASRRPGPGREGRQAVLARP